jgi:aldehyde:ferredoxin oxidoreductase
MRTLYDNVGPDTDPLSPKSVITFANGPLAGTTSPASSRICVVAKSPLTGIFARSNSGGFWGTELKVAGYDALIVRGAADEPVYLEILDGDVQLRDARRLWGLDTWETERVLRRERRDNELKTLSIGPAGENLSLHAAMINDRGRAAATRGLAAILGAKKLKAVAVRGTRGIELARPPETIELCKRLSNRFQHDPMYASHSRYGTNSWVGDTVIDSISKATGRPPTKELMSEAFEEHYEKNLSCESCPLHCSHFYNIRHGRYAGVKGEGVEGNTQLVGLVLGVLDAAFVCAFNNLCNQLGLDTMGAGTAIAFAMSLRKEGMLDSTDTDGLDLVLGNADASLELAVKLARNEGIGQVLNLGIVRAAEQIGRGAEELVSHCKNYPSHGPGFMSSAKTTLAHSIATRGHDHLTGSPGIETPHRQPEMTDEILERLGQERYDDPSFFTESPWDYQPKYARRVRDVENRFAIADMAGTCKFVAREVLLVEGIGMADFAELLSVVTGGDFSEADLHKIAEREMLLERAFNAREGIRRIDDYPHAFRYEIENGTRHPRYDRSRYRIRLEDYDLLLDEYYRLRGCGIKTGIPSRVSLEAVGLSDVADDLEQRGLI